MSTDLNRFLDDQAAQGLDQGVGSFTLDLAKAQQKLVQFGAAEPELWLLKVLQSAAAWKAEELSISYHRRDLQLEFQVSAEVTLEDLLKASENLSSRSPESEFMLAVLWAASHGGQKALLCLERGKLRSNLVVSSGGQTSMSREQGAWASEEVTRLRIRVSRVRRWPSLSQIGKLPIRDLLRQTIWESALVRERGLFYPGEVLLDGRTVERHLDRKLFPYGPFYRFTHYELPLSAEGLGIHPPPRFLGEQVDEGIHQSPRVFANEPFFYCKAPGPAGGFISLLMNQRQIPSRITFVHRGMIVEHRVLNVSFTYGMKELVDRVAEHELTSLEIVLEVASEDLDLLGFSVKEPAKILKERLDPHRESFNQVVGKALLALPELYRDTRVRTPALEQTKPSDFLTLKGYWLKRRTPTIEQTLQVLRFRRFSDFL